MTERSESERAELVALADELEGGRVIHDYPTETWLKAASALRRLAAQDQKPVAWLHTHSEFGRDLQFTELTQADRNSGWTEKPLYLSPPPAAGWDEFKPTHDQINSACMTYRHDFGLLDATGQQSLQWMAGEWLSAWQKEIKALRHNAPPDSGAGEPDDVTRATAYAESLAVALWEKFDKSEAPQWKPLSGDLIGLLTQIDNMTTGLVPDHGGADAGVACSNCGDPLTVSDAPLFCGCCREMGAKPAPVAADASVEARLREALEKIAGSHWERAGRCQTDVDDVPDLTAEDAMREARKVLSQHPRTSETKPDLHPFVPSALTFGMIYKARKALSTHPHASDCDKQGER